MRFKKKAGVFRIPDSFERLTPIFHQVNGMLAWHQQRISYFCQRHIRYKGTSLIKNTPLLGPYSRTIPGVLLWSLVGGGGCYERGTPVEGDGPQLPEFCPPGEVSPSSFSHSLQSDTCASACMRSLLRARAFKLFTL
jgi:hypothetical protein